MYIRFRQFLQVKILTITDNNIEYANKVKEELEKEEIRVELDSRNEKIGYKIREAQLQKIPYMLVIGEKEMQNNTVGVRSRSDGDIGAIEISEFIENIKTEIENHVK